SFFFQAEDGIRDFHVTGVQTCALPIYESVWAYRWAQWFQGSRPEIAEEPADWAKQQMELLNKLRSEGNAEMRNDLMKQILVIARSEERRVGKECRLRWESQHKEEHHG